LWEETDLQVKTEGTYHFLAPECCSANTTEYSGIAADIWALGVTLFAMVYRNVPF